MEGERERRREKYGEIKRKKTTRVSATFGSIRWLCHPCVPATKYSYKLTWVKLPPRCFRVLLLVVVGDVEISTVPMANFRSWGCTIKNIFGISEMDSDLCCQTLVFVETRVYVSQFARRCHGSKHDPKTETNCQRPRRIRFSKHMTNRT